VARQVLSDHIGVARLVLHRNHHAITGLLLGASRKELAVTVHDRPVRSGPTLAATVEALNAVADDLAGELTLQPLGWR
jgi:hypothetical protein